MTVFGKVRPGFERHQVIIETIEVWYADRQKGWAVTSFDADGKELNPPVFHQYKEPAILEARAMADGVTPIYVYARNGLSRRRINPFLDDPHFDG